MMFKCFLLFVALSAIPAQTQGSTLPQQQKIVLTDLINQLSDGNKHSKNVGDLDIASIIGDLATDENIADLLESLELPEEAVCLLRVLLESDEELHATGQEALNQILRWLKLVEQRELELKVCEEMLGDNPGLIAIARHLKCRVQVNATTGVAAAAAAADVQYIFWELRDVFPEALVCADLLG